jgi:hypothetical protein
VTARRQVLIALACAAACIGLVTVANAGVAIHCDGGRCEGTNDPDEIFGSPKKDTILAKQGQDFVFSAKGADDTIKFGPNKDCGAGAGGDDVMEGGRCSDKGVAKCPADIGLFGDTGNDEIDGGAGNDGLAGRKGRTSSSVATVTTSSTPSRG